MPEYQFDLFTIGAGSGGVAASRRAGAYGARVALCESGRVGGTCVLRGCVPKKLLVYGSHFHDDFEDAKGFGWTVEPPRFDWPTLIKAKDHELDRLNRIYERLLHDSKVALVRGQAQVVDPHTVEVLAEDGTRARYTAAHILVATGGVPMLPEIPGVELGITSNEALSLPELPKRVVIVGGGYIAVEFAGIFRGFGSEVTMLMRDAMPLRGFDPDVRAQLSSELGRRGITLRGETMVRGVDREDDGSLTLSTEYDEIGPADAVLFATGRRPNTQGLGLPTVGVKLDELGAIPVDESSQTVVPSIFAVGDCTNRLNLTPVAIAEGRAVAEALFNNNPVRVDHQGVPTAVFSQPPVSTVGLTEPQAQALFPSVDVYVASFRPMRNTLGGREERTMMKMVVDGASGRVLGCHMVGADAPEIIQGLAVAMRCGATKADFDRTIGIHPSAAEEFVTMRDKRPPR